MAFEDLFEAIELGDLDTLNSLLKEEKGINLLDAWPGIILSAAAISGHLNLVKHILVIPEVLQACIQDHTQLLECTACAGHLPVLNHFIKIPEILADVNNWGSQVFIEACGGGSLEVVNRLLEVPEILPLVTVQNNYPFFTAACNGHALVAERLLKFPEVVAAVIQIPDPAAPVMGGPPLDAAASNGHIEVMKLMLNIPGIMPRLFSEHLSALKAAAAAGQLKIVNLILNIPELARFQDKESNDNISLDEEPNGNNISPHEFYCIIANAMHAAAEHGHLLVIERFLEIPSVLVYAANDFETLHLAALNGHLLVVNRLLKIFKTPHQIAENNNSTLEITAANGHLDVVDRLLEIPAVKAAITPYQAFLIDICRGNLKEVNDFLEVPENIENLKFEVLVAATQNSQTDVFDRLLEIQRVRQLVNVDNGPILMSIAVFKGNLQIIEKLLEIVSVQASIAGSGFYQSQLGMHDGRNQSHLSAAAYLGHLQVLERLLQDPTIWISDRINMALNEAASRGQLPIVERLLRNKALETDVVSKIDFRDNTALIKAISNGHVAVVERLLQNPRVKNRIAVLNNLALRSAAEKGYFKIVDLLLKDLRVLSNIKALNDEALRKAVANGHLKVIMRLLQAYKDSNIPYPRDVVLAGYESLDAFFETYRFALQNVHTALLEYVANVTAKLVEDYAEDDKKISIGDYRRLFLYPGSLESKSIAEATRQAGARSGAGGAGTFSVMSYPSAGSSSFGSSGLGSSTSSSSVSLGSSSSWSNSSALVSVDAPSWASLSTQRIGSHSSSSLNSASSPSLSSGISSSRG